MKYDIISLNNELDMLEIRLNVLNEYVDYFVIIEATETFSGVPKPLNYLLNKEKYKKFENKIIYHVVNDTPKDVNDQNCNQKYLNQAKISPNVTWEHQCWLKEFYQKEYIMDALKDLNDDDVCYISDLDEIWNYNLKFDIEPNKIYRFNIDYCYIEYLNLRTNENWTYFTGPIVTRWGTVKNDVLNHVRSPRGEAKNDPRYVYLSNGGWHFNALGGIQKKVEDFVHPHYSIWEMNGRKTRTGNFIEEENLPKLLIEKKDKLKKFFLENS
jgi:beta-1,4-mannosyl-glycoprotein beta-1,4-N-acetylglucosaminyltransferase